MNAKEALNKIKWGEKEPEKYFVFYIDRISKELKKIKFSEIKKIEGSFFIMKKDGEETEIPIHRIRELRKENKLIWRRGNDS